MSGDSPPTERKARAAFYVQRDPIELRESRRPGDPIGVRDLKDVRISAHREPATGFDLPLVEQPRILTDVPAGQSPPFLWVLFCPRRNRFGLPDDPGYGSPDPSLGIGKDDFSIRWTAKLVPPGTGVYTFAADSDGVVRLWIGDTMVIEKADHKRREAEGAIGLNQGKEYPVKVEYVHRDGKASAHVHWSGQDFTRRILRPIAE